MRRGATLAVLLLAGCGAPRSYLDVDLTRPPTPMTIVARLAQGGDKQAQLELGRAFEDAAGVPRDLDRACRLYRLAGSRAGGTIYVYQPKVGNSPGRVVPIDTGPVQPGAAGGDRAAARPRLSGDRVRPRGIRMPPRRKAMTSVQARPHFPRHPGPVPG